MCAKPGLVDCTYNPSTLEVEAGGAEAQGYPLQCSELEASLS